MNKQIAINFHLESPRKKAIIIGQAPPKKKDGVPFKKTRLYNWFSKINMTQLEVLTLFEFEALVDFFPGSGDRGDNKPMPSDIMIHIPRVLKKIEDNQIDLIIPVGKMAIEYVLSLDNIKLSDVIGKVYKETIFNQETQIKTIIPLPHPSGLSTWSFNSENAILLEKSLADILNHLK